MNLRRVAATVVAAAAGIATSAAGRPDGEVLHRRATVLAETTGRVEIRKVAGPRLDVIVPCESDRRGCREERVYDEVARFDFVSESRVIEAGASRVSESPEGTILLAVGTSDASRAALWDGVEDALRGLSAGAFLRPFAGLGAGDGPFDRVSLASRSELPTWVCLRRDGGDAVFRFDPLRVDTRDGDAPAGGGIQTYAQPPTPVCDEMASATADVSPDVLRTAPTPERLLETTVSHRDAVRFDAVGAAPPQERPAGAELTKVPAIPGARALSAPESALGVVERATVVENGWRFDGVAEPVAVPIGALDDAAWLHVFTTETAERTFGADPRDETVATRDLFVAFIATAPARRLELEPDGTVSDLPTDPLDTPEGRAVIDRSGFESTLRDALDRDARPPLDVIASWIGLPPKGLESEGWMVVVCPGDGTATYYLPPTRAHNRLTNAESFCAAVETRLR